MLTSLPRWRPARRHRRLGGLLIRAGTETRGSTSEVFGVVVAYFAPIETQGRAGLHAHMHLWIMHPLSAHVLDRLRRGLLDEDLAQSLKTWREAVLEKVASMQFDCVEEPGRQLGVKLPPARCQGITQQACYMTGVEEKMTLVAGIQRCRGQSGVGFTSLQLTAGATEATEISTQN